MKADSTYEKKKSQIVNEIEGIELQNISAIIVEELEGIVSKEWVRKSLPLEYKDKKEF